MGAGTRAELASAFSSYMVISRSGVRVAVQDIVVVQLVDAIKQLLIGFAYLRSSLQSGKFRVEVEGNVAVGHILGNVGLGLGDRCLDFLIHAQHRLRPNPVPSPFNQLSSNPSLVPDSPFHHSRARADVVIFGFGAEVREVCGSRLQALLQHHLLSPLLFQMRSPLTQPQVRLKM